MRERDRDAVSVLRSALATVANAEAVPHPTGTNTPQPVTSHRVAGTAVGVGSTEVERRTLTESEVRSLVETVAAEREMAAQTYDGAGHPERAGSLRAEAAALRRVVGD